MSLLHDPRRTIFAYNAHATGFGGRLTKPGADIIPSQASVSLAQSGGEGYVIVRNYSYKGLITFDEASAYVAGSEEEEENGRVFNTLATVTVRNLNIANMVHVDLLAARLTSRHPESEFPGVNPSLPRPEGDITFEGTFVRGLTIAGEPVQVSLDPLTQAPTYASFTGEDQSQGTESPEGAIRRPAPPQSQVRPSDYTKIKDMVVTSLARDKSRWRTEIPDLEDHPEAEREHHIYKKNHTIYVREFGKIYVAEVVMKRGQRRLGLLRFDLGCAVCGDATGGNVEGNGTPTGP